MNIIRLKYKKILFILLIAITFIMIYTSFNVRKVKASLVTNDNENATWNVNNETVNETFGVTHSLAYGNTTDTRYQNKVGNQMVNMISMKTDGISSKLVSYAMLQGNHGYARSGLSYIAEEYEKTHPGWIVVAGINGDQYYTDYYNKDRAGTFYYYNQPYYPHIIDNENRFAYVPFGGESMNYVGILNDSSNKSLLKASTVKGLYLDIYDSSNKVVDSIKVDKVNEQPLNGETAIWISYVSENNRDEYIEFDLNTNNNIYVVDNPTLAYLSNSKTYSVGSKCDALFAKGVISSITHSDKVERFQFAIESNNSVLSSNLSVDSYIEVEYKYNDDAMNYVESAFGYHSVQRFDDKDVSSNQSYDTNRYNRSIFGRKEDGTYVLLTVAKDNTYSGTSHDESNAILKYYGVVEAYQQDGGGSVTAIVRNENGGFDITNESSDSGKQRSIFNGCFFVIRDPEYISYKKDSTRTSITLSRVSSFNKEYICNLKATINNKTYDINSDTVEITGLDEDTTYDVLLSYDVKENDTIVHTSFTIKASTESYQKPFPGVSIDNVEGSFASFVLDKNNNFDSIKVQLLDNIYTFDDEGYLCINNLTKNTTYNLTVLYSFYDNISNITRNETYDITFTTKSSDTPFLEKFDLERISKNEVKVNIILNDEDRIVRSLILYYTHNNIEEFEVELNTNGENIINCPELDLYDYSFRLSYSYKIDGETSKIKTDSITASSSSLYPGKTEPVDQDDIDNPTDDEKPIIDDVVDEKPKKKCLFKNIYIISLLQAVSLIYILFKKRK